MKLVIFTSNSRRHIFVANSLAKKADKCLVVSEVKPASAPDTDSDPSIAKHFQLRDQTERKFFPNSDYFKTNTLAISKGDVNNEPFIKTFKKFSPDMVIVYGSSIIKPNLLKYFPVDKSINLHLGLSPYYRGSGTNFWPFVNEELEFVGSTLLHIDAGVDTGDILAHVRPRIETGDNVHTVGCKVIKASAEALQKVIDKVKKGETLTRVSQWKAKKEKYYKNRDFTKEVLDKYYDNLEHGLVDKYLKKKPPKLKLIS